MLEMEAEGWESCGDHAPCALSDFVEQVMEGKKALSTSTFGLNYENKILFLELLLVLIESNFQG